MICVAWQSNDDGNTDVSRFIEFARERGLTCKLFPKVEGSEENRFDLAEVVVPNAILEDFISACADEGIRIDGMDCSDVTQLIIAQESPSIANVELCVEDDDPGWNIVDGVRTSSGTAADVVPEEWHT